MDRGALATGQLPGSVRVPPDTEANPPDCEGQTALRSSPKSPARANIEALDQQLHAQWQLGANILLNWSPSDLGLHIVALPIHLLALLVRSDEADPGRGLRRLLGEKRQLSLTQLMNQADRLGVSPVHVRLPHPETSHRPSRQAVDQMIRRHSITHEENRAVILFDIVGFSLRSPLEQVAQLNSLIQSINLAQDKILRRHMNVRIGQSTTGDGFYLWARERNIESITNLYHLMHLVLAENAAARLKASDASLVPLLKTAFLVGSYYTIFQNDGLRPGRQTYVVGEATIELSRILEGAAPGQVLVGDFQARIPANDRPGAELVTIEAQGFIERLQDSLSGLYGLRLGGEKITTIKCYLTGEKKDGGRFTIRKHRIVDKHGRSRTVYNAKINIHLEGGDPIFLGLQEKDLKSRGEGTTPLPARGEDGKTRPATRGDKKESVKHWSGGASPD